MRSAYTSWIGHAVVLRLAVEELQVPIPGVITEESDGGVRVHVCDGWDMYIDKSMILAVEEVSWVN
jgi:hypothetical protein